MTEQLAQEEKLAVEEGAYVAEIAKGSGAEKAGVEVGDVITAVDGTPIRSMDDLILQVRRKQVGDEVTLTVSRDGNERGPQGDRGRQARRVLGAEHRCPPRPPKP